MNPLTLTSIILGGFGILIATLMALTSNTEHVATVIEGDIPEAVPVTEETPVIPEPEIATTTESLIDTPTTTPTTTPITEEATTTEPVTPEVVPQEQTSEPTTPIETFYTDIRTCIAGMWRTSGFSSMGECMRTIRE